jgi:hypothetical protein
LTTPIARQVESAEGGAFQWAAALAPRHAKRHPKERKLKAGLKKTLPEFASLIGMMFSAVQ